MAVAILVTSHIMLTAMLVESMLDLISHIKRPKEQIPEESTTYLYQKAELPVG